MTDQDAAAGSSLNQCTAPDWARDYLSYYQAEDASRRTQWVTLLDQSAVSGDAHHVGLRMMWHTAGRNSGASQRGQGEHDAWPAVPTLARSVKRSENTVRKALSELVAAGWLLRADRKSRSRRQMSAVYTLAWPHDPAVMLPPEAVPGVYCDHELADGTRCRRRAGWGAVEDHGPCKFHGGTPRNHSSTPPHPVKGDPSPHEGTDPSPHEPTPSPREGEVRSSTEARRQNASAEARSAEEAFAADLRAAGIDDRTIAAQLHAHRQRLEVAAS